VSAGLGNPQIWRIVALEPAASNEMATRPKGAWPSLYRFHRVIGAQDPRWTITAL
jgi:hypothetical protein